MAPTASPSRIKFQSIPCQQTQRRELGCDGHDNFELWRDLYVYTYGQIGSWDSASGRKDPRRGRSGWGEDHEVTRAGGDEWLASYP